MSHDQDEVSGFVPLENFDDFKEALEIIKQYANGFDLWYGGATRYCCGGRYEEDGSGHKPDCRADAFVKKWSK